ncbi:MAG: NAD(P) transhydrogenase subunit alpha [Planctomycetota bacterium]
MILFAPRQADPEETRCPLTPAVVKKLVSRGVGVVIEPGLGGGALLNDEGFTAAGATLAGSAQAVDEAWAAADAVVTVGPPTAERVGSMTRGAVLVGMVDPVVEHGVVAAAAGAGVSLMALEFVPRISRAQAMDVLSSQANLAGYKAALLGASAAPKLMPMMITAAGTLSPGRVLVIGVGVAGLQAIATAKRLGAIVEAYDVRTVTKEQAQSLGARFVELPKQEDGAGGGEGEGGYAKEQSAEQQRRQAELLAKHVTGADVVITTAAVFGKAPPMLIPDEVVAGMKAGSVIVDMAASAAYDTGNCAATRPGQTVVTANGVTVIGTLNLPGTLPVHASTVLANNVMALLETLLPPEEGSGETGRAVTLKIDFEDEVHQSALITHGGEILSERVRDAMALETEAVSDDG